MKEAASAETQATLARLRAFCFPAGEERARSIRGIRTTQRGEIRSAPGARWLPFTAEEFVDTTHSAFHWDARISTGKITSVSVTDAYEHGHGRLVVKLGGMIRLNKTVGPEVDKGEMQRYLAAIGYCPPALLNHPTLHWTTTGLSNLHVADREDPTCAAVDLQIGEDGRVLTCRADRPRLVGKQTILTPWSGIYSDYGEWDGLRVPRRLEVTWTLPDGPFVYFRCELIAFTLVR